jgi:hypothetical protein
MDLDRRYSDVDGFLRQAEGQLQCHAHTRLLRVGCGVA